MKNAFYFTLEALFIAKIFKFCLDFLVIYKNGLIKKIRFVSKFMRQNLVNKQLQYTYCPVSQKVKTIRQ